MSNFYTGMGDSGYTQLPSKGRVRKDDIALDAVGDIDELNSFIGLCIANITNDRVAKVLRRVQNDLFVIGAQISMPEKAHKPATSRVISESDVKELEASIDELGSAIKLDKFVLPGGSIGASFIHVARSICRRAERSIVRVNEEKYSNIYKYVNRLSSYLFVAALYINRLEGIDESNPTY
ncbi:MAG: cob(I)yrinic acid a,c-diamide adenosyltransferase [Candidatus Micrarchaeia archaeon]